MVNPIRDQGSCGSCWAFTAVAQLESQYAIQFGDLYELSEQHLVGCDYAQSGCNGGVPEYAFDFAVQEGNVLRSDYPYEQTDSTGCKSGYYNRLAYVN